MSWLTFKMLRVSTARKSEHYIFIRPRKSFKVVNKNLWTEKLKSPTWKKILFFIVTKRPAGESIGGEKSLESAPNVILGQKTKEKIREVDSVKARQIVSKYFFSKSTKKSD